jgi:hypothetical protein
MRYRNRPSLVVLGSALNQPAANVGEGATNVQAAANEVYVPGAKSCGLAPAKPGVRQRPDERAVRPSRGRQLLHLVMSQELPLSADYHPGELYSTNRITDKSAGTDGMITYQRDDTDGLAGP